MTQRVQPTSTIYIDSQPVGLSTLTVSSQTPEEQINAFEQDFLARADYQPLHNQETYKSQIRAFVNDLRTQLNRMRALNSDTLQICSEMRNHIEKYNLALNTLYTHNGEYHRGKEGALAHNTATARQIRGPSVKFTSFSRQGVTKALGNMDMRDHLWDIQIAGNLVKATGEAVVGAAKAVCSVTETSKQVCKSTLDLAGRAGKAVLEATGTKEKVKQAIRYWQTCEGATLAKVLVEHYGYAPEEAKEIAKEYVSAVGSLATATVGSGATSLAIKGVKLAAKGVKHASKGAAAATEASSAASPVMKEFALSNSEELTATSLNQYANQRLYFPNMSQIQNSTVQDLHQAWSRNQETILGILAQESIPRFGFHATGPKGVKAILNTRTSLSKKGDFIWVAGYRYEVTPLAQLADLYNIVGKVQTYIKQRGGTFVVETSDALSFGSSIKAYEVDKLILDTPQHRRFLNLMQRDGEELLVTAAKNGEAAIPEGALLNADEFHLKFTPDNFNSIVKGVILEKDTLYPRKIIKNLLSNADNSKGILAERFKIQELIMGAFEKLNVCGEFSSAEWEIYQNAGKRILHLSKKETAVPLKDLIQMEKRFAQMAPTGKRFFSSYDKASLTSSQAAQSSNSLATINRRLIGNADIGGFKDTHVKGFVSLHSKEMVIELNEVVVEEGALNAPGLIDQMKHFARKSGADSLYVELKFCDDLELERSLIKLGLQNKIFHVPQARIETQFQEAIQQYPTALRRSYRGHHEFDPDGNAYLFEIPLH
jgi:hypothetical protein